MPNDTLDMPIPEDLKQRYEWAEENSHKAVIVGSLSWAANYMFDDIEHIARLEAENRALLLKLDEATRPINRDVVKAFMAIDHAMYPTIIDTVNAILENRRMNSNPPADQPKEKP